MVSYGVFEFYATSKSEAIRMFSEGSADIVNSSQDELMPDHRRSTDAFLLRDAEGRIQYEHSFLDRPVEG